MQDIVITWFAGFPRELATFFIAMIPLTELRASIPIALYVYNLPVWSAFLWSVLGDVIPMFFIVWLIGPISRFLSEHSKFFKKLFDWWFKRVEKHFDKKHARFGELALMIFVAIPLPITGAWTGAVASFLFEIKPRRAIFFIIAGILISGVIVTLLSLGIPELFNH